MAFPRTNSFPTAELMVELTRDGGIALHRQVEGAIRDGVRTGRLPRGAVLPPTRRLAAELGVSRGVIVEAYAQLVAEGYLTSRGGGYTEVALGATTASSQPPKQRSAPARPVVDFGYGRADVSTFPRAAWLRSVRRVLTRAPDERLGYLDGRGVPELRDALADYLNRVRGTAARPENIVITNGYAQGVSLLIDVLAARGARRLAAEDPSADDDARLVAASAGLEIVGVPVDHDGLRVDALDRLEADALILTPSHQWPTGGVLSPAARSAVLAWAERSGAILIEDDYDAEYRYDRAPIGAMQGLAPHSVVYAGTASKTLAPGLRLGWFVLPPDLAEALALAKVIADRGSPVIEQLTFADFLACGGLDRHLRRMRAVYRARRDVLLAAFAQGLPDLDPVGIAAGLHLVAWLPRDLEESAVITAAARHGVAVAGVAPYRLVPSEDAGLIFGYSTLTERAIRDGVDRLAAAITDVRASR